MTISKKLWLGFGTMLVLLGLCGLTLLVRWPTSAVFDSSPESALRDMRLSFEIALVLVVAAGGIAAATGVVLRRKLVVSDVPLEKAFEEQFQQSVESAGFGAYSFDHETQTLVWSKQLRKIHGLPLDAVLTRERILQLIHPHDREHFRQRLVGMFSLPEGATYECEYRIFRPDGEERWLRDRGTFTFAGSNQSRRPIRAFGMILDVTDQKQNEELQHESEARHRVAFEGASVGMYQADSTTGHLLRVNRSFCQMLGFSSAELLKETLQGIVHPDDRDSLVAGVESLRRGEASEFRAEHRFLHKSGRNVWGDVTLNLVQDLRGRPLRTLAVIKDITERRQSEDKLRAADQRLRAFMDNSAVCGWMKDEDGRYVFLSKNHQRHFGVTFDDWQGKTDFELWPLEIAEQFQTNDRAVLTSGRAVEVLEETRSADGKQAWWLCHKFPYEDENGNRFVGGLGVDVTAHKRIEEALRESERRLSLVMQGANVGLFDWVLDGDQVHFSREWKSQLGYDDSEIGNRFEEWQSRVHPNDLEPTLAKVRKFLAQPWPEYEVEFRMRHKNGTWRWILTRASLIQDSAGKPVRMIGIHLDITARKEIEESLRESEERLRLANEAANIGTYFSEFEFDRSRYSPELCLILGVEPGVDRKIEEGFQYMKPEDLRRVRTAFEAAINPAGDGRMRSEARIVRPDGEERWIASNGRVTFRETPSGRVPWRLVGACLDITDRKRTEESLRQLNERLEDRVAERTRVLYAKQERLQAILNINFSAVLTCDRQGLVESVNLAGVRMFGYSIDEMIGQDFRKFVPPPDGQTQDAANRSYLEMGKDRMSGYSVEVVACRKDGSTFPADLAVSEIPDLGLFCSILRDLSDHKRLEREVSEATAFEQRRIGQDLHDSVGQRLTALTMLAQDFVESFGSDAQVSDARPHHLASPASPSLSSLSRAELAERLRRDLQQTLEEVRSISRNLNPVPVDSQGLTAALADLVERMRLQSRVKCSFDCESPVVIEDNVTATHLFHIAQEALSNALRHAHAREVRISLRQDDLQIALQIQDDGDGVSWPQPRPEGIGLRIMKGRADMIGAMLTFDRANPKGTQVNCILKTGSKHRN